MTDSASSERSCGGCTACCKTFENLHFKKPVGVWCKHAKIGTGCSIYGSHPDECRGYKCMWLLGYIPVESRPDQIRMVFEANTESVNGRSVVLARAWEVTPGASQKKMAQDIISKMLEKKWIVLVRTLKLSGGYHDTLRFPGESFTAQEMADIIQLIGAE